MLLAMSLRDRKRARTRQALVEAAATLFERDGYDETTVADIAAAAEIGTRTFFSYFASKEELLFPESDVRVRAAVEAIADRGPAEGPAEVLLGDLDRLDDPAAVQVAVEKATDIALRPWLRAAADEPQRSAAADAGAAGEGRGV